MIHSLFPRLFMIPKTCTPERYTCDRAHIRTDTHPSLPPHTHIDIRIFPLESAHYGLHMRHHAFAPAARYVWQAWETVVLMTEASALWHRPPLTREGEGKEGKGRGERKEKDNCVKTRSLIDFGQLGFISVLFYHSLSYLLLFFCVTSFLFSLSFCI